MWLQVIILLGADLLGTTGFSWLPGRSEGEIQIPGLDAVIFEILPQLPRKWNETREQKEM